MEGWFYFGHRRVQSENNFLTIPPSLFESDGVFGPDQTSVFWRFDEDLECVLVSNRPRPINQLREFEDTILKDQGGSKGATIPIKFFNHSNNDLPEKAVFDHGEGVHFVATREMVSGDKRTCYLVKTERLDEIVPGPDAWVKTSSNLQRLFELRWEVGSDRLIPGELTGEATGKNQMDHPGIQYTVDYREIPQEGELVEIQSALPLNVRTRWYRQQENDKSRASPPSYTVLELELLIIDLDDRILQPVNGVEKFILDFEEDLKEWKRISAQESIEEVPEPILKSLEEENWTLDTQYSP